MARSYLLLVAVVLATFGVTLACKCTEYTPRSGACNSDFVLVGTVLSKNESSEETYVLDVKNIYKGEAAAGPALLDKGCHKEVILHTPHLTSCKLYLNQGTRYLVTGRVTDNQLHAAGCDYNAPWDTMGSEEKDGFKGAYYPNC